MPATVLSGYLGAGKTTLLNHALSNQQGMRIAVIVNDMSELNIDIALVRSRTQAPLKGDDALVELSNGCIGISMHGVLPLSMSTCGPIWMSYLNPNNASIPINNR